MADNDPTEVDPTLPNPNALGFQTPDAPRDEKYNTRFLVSNMNKERRQKQLIALGVVVAAILGVGLVVAFQPAPPLAVKPAAEATPAAAEKPLDEVKEAAKAPAPAGEPAKAEAPSLPTGN